MILANVDQIHLFLLAEVVNERLTVVVSSYYRLVLGVGILLFSHSFRLSSHVKGLLERFLTVFQLTGIQLLDYNKFPITLALFLYHFPYNLHNVKRG